MSELRKVVERAAQTLPTWRPVGEWGSDLRWEGGTSDDYYAILAARHDLHWKVGPVQILKMLDVIDVARELYEESLERNGPMEGNRFADVFAALDEPQKTQKGKPE